MEILSGQLLEDQPGSSRAYIVDEDQFVGALVSNQARHDGGKSSVEIPERPFRAVNWYHDGIGMGAFTGRHRTTLSRSAIASGADISAVSPRSMHNCS